MNKETVDYYYKLYMTWSNESYEFVPRVHL